MASWFFPVERWSDISIFQSGLKSKPHVIVVVTADKEYKYPVCSSLSEALRARHETFNRRLKRFSVLSSIFLYDKSLHRFCFHAVLRLSIALPNTNSLYFIFHEKWKAGVIDEAKLLVTSAINYEMKLVKTKLVETKIVQLNTSFYSFLSRNVLAVNYFIIAISWNRIIQISFNDAVVQFFIGTLPVAGKSGMFSLKI